MTRQTLSSAMIGLYLGIETSGEGTALSLVQGPEVLGSLREPSQARHNEVIFEMLDRLFGAASRPRSELAGIGVSIGPGMFTSLRVGLAVAKGIALALNLPLKGISTLDALVLTARRSVQPPTPGGTQPTTGFFVPLIDARKGEVYAALYRNTERLSDFKVIDPRILAVNISEHERDEPEYPVTFMGSGAKRYQAELAKTFGPRVRILDLEYPAPEVIASEAERWIETGNADSRDDLAPSYLRQTDAELKRQKERPGSVACVR